jgi:hypothetical protein
MKEAMLSEFPPHERAARSRGEPMLGSGAVYPIIEERFLERDFEIPSWWKLCYGLDVGWNKTAAAWGALDPQTDVLHLYAEYYVSRAEPAVHVQGIRAKGVWIPGVIDPASRGRSQFDGEQLIGKYREMGLSVTPAINAVEAGIQAVWGRLSSGRLKVFESLQHWRDEIRGYCRDDKGKVKKEYDHLMDATRYLVMSGLGRAMSVEDWETRFEDQEQFITVQTTGRSAVTGY